MAVILDSGAIIGFLDRSDALHRAAAEKLSRLLGERESLLVSVVTFAEVLTGAKLGHHDEDVARGFFDDLITEVVPVDRAVGERAADLRALRRSLRMPDALILATAELHPQVHRFVCADKHFLELKLKGLSCDVEILRF